MRNPIIFENVTSAIIDALESVYGYANVGDIYQSNPSFKQGVDKLADKYMDHPTGDLYYITENYEEDFWHLLDLLDAE